MDLVHQDQHGRDGGARVQPTAIGSKINVDLLTKQGKTLIDLGDHGSTDSHCSVMWQPFDPPPQQGKTDLVETADHRISGPQQFKAIAKNRPY